MTIYALIFTLAALGISETAYLYSRRRAGKRPICVIDKETCHAVLESKYNSLLFGIPNEVLGFAFNASVATITAFLVIGTGLAEILNSLMKLIVASGLFMSLIFTYLQWRVIKAWCFWCLMSALTIFLMGVILAVNNFLTS
ncbi:MAG: hypothetical protein HYT21_02525 [Candidatus Nealsonbacteria bacterium]|nr:hypothetical protein [Candidatus Nealsonbacteria bacterium]